MANVEVKGTRYLAEGSERRLALGVLYSVEGLRRDAGLVEVRVGLVVPTFRDGDGKRVAQITMEHIREAVVSAGMGTGQEMDEVVAELGRFAEDDRTLMSIAPTFQVWGRKAYV